MLKKKIICVSICIIFIGISVNAVNSIGTRFDDPVVTITNPDDGSIVNDPNIEVLGNAFGMGIKRIEYEILYAGGGMYGSYFDIDPPVEYYEFSIPFEIVEGADGNFITVNAVDLNDDEGSDSITIYYETEEDDTEPPSVFISYPNNNDVFIDPEISLIGYVTDNIGIVNFTAYQLWNNEEIMIYSEVFTDPLTSYKFNIVLSLKPGLNTLKVNASDAAKNEGNESVNVTHEYECGHRIPTLTDNSGNTTFHSVLVGCDHYGTPSELRGCQQGVEILNRLLQGKEGWNYQNTSLLYSWPTRESVQNAINEAKDRAQPGDEFLFYFADHGGNRIIQDSSDDPDETDGYDEHILLADGRVTDDELAEWLSGFRDCVTITVKLDCCHAGGFTDGINDLQNATNADGDPYGPDHINIEPACAHNETISERPYYWNDSDNDYKVDPDELREPDRTIWNDLNGNGRRDRDDSVNYWIDFNEDGEMDNNEIISAGSSLIKFLSDFLRSNIEGLSNDSDFNNSPTTKADRDKNGITTTKELYEFSIHFLNEWLGIDNDNDGLLDEDGYEFEQNDTDIIRLYIDNDGDGFYDEDPGPPSFAFWFDEPPDMPEKPIGFDEGKIGELYSYSTSTIDPENDDVFYMFDWGNGEYSGWLGPYISGESCSISYSWEKIGDYAIRVKSRDRCYAESEWSDPLIVSMPKSKEFTLFEQLIENLIERFPMLERLLN